MGIKSKLKTLGFTEKKQTRQVLAGAFQKSGMGLANNLFLIEKYDAEIKRLQAENEEFMHAMKKADFEASRLPEEPSAPDPAVQVGGAPK